MPIPPTLLAILAGGAGSRMGFPKSLLKLGDRPILAYLYERFAWPGPTLLVTSPGRERPPGWDLFTAEVVDPEADLGPLRGLLTALEHAATEVVVVATVDMPCVTREQLSWLAEQLGDRETVFCRVAGRVEPFPSAFRRSFAKAVGEQLASGDASMQALARRAEVRVVDPPGDWGAETWTNLNRPDDLSQWLSR